MPPPIVGDMVHFVSYGSKGGEFPQTCYAATVTEVMPYDEAEQLNDADTIVGTHVVKPWGYEFHRGVHRNDGYDPTPATGERTDLCRGRDYPGGTWHWPY